MTNSQHLGHFSVALYRIKTLRHEPGCSVAGNGLLINFQCLLLRLNATLVTRSWQSPTLHIEMVRSPRQHAFTPPMRRSFAFLTSENYFPMIGVQAFRGRFYNAEECKPNANMAVVVSSYGFWKRNGARDDFVGSTLRINGQPYPGIGITPDGFSGANALIAPDIWLPLGIRSQFGSAFGDSETTHDLLDPKNYTFNLVARMRSGLTIDAAKAR